VSLALGIQHAMLKRHIVIYGLPRYTIFFFHIVSKTARFLKNNVVKHKICVVLYTYCV